VTPDVLHLDARLSHDVSGRNHYRSANRVLWTVAAFIGRKWQPESGDWGCSPMTAHCSGAANGTVAADQSSGRAAKSRLVFLYQAIPDKGCLHLPFMPFKALSCVSSPPATVSFR